MRRRTARVFAGGGVLLLAFGCGSPANQTTSLGNADAGRTVVVAVGDKLEVTLQTIGPGQYGDPIVSPGSVMFLGESPAGAPNPGGARQLYRFEAVAPGRADISIPHTGGWPDGPVIPAFAITVEVR